MTVIWLLSGNAPFSPSTLICLQACAVLDLPHMRFQQANSCVTSSRCIGAFKRAVKSSFSAYSVNHVTFPIVVVRWGIYPIENNLLNAVPPGLEESSGALPSFRPNRPDPQLILFPLS